MTDCEACIWIKFRSREAADRLLAGDVTAENDLAAFDHALQAIEDRAALVTIHDEPPADDVERSSAYRAVAAARRHMQGEPCM